MKQLGNYVLALALHGVGCISSWMPQNIRLVIGRWLGFILRIASSKRYGITLNNIQSAFPEKTPEWHRAIARASYGNLGIVLSEILAFSWLDNSKIVSLIHYTNIELLQEAASRGKGIVLLSGHYGNWELLAYSAGVLSGIPINVVVTHQHNKYADEHINNFRTRYNNRIIPTANAARKIVQKLRLGEAVALLADQSADGSKDIFIEFFGRPAATYETPAAFALKFGAPIIIGFAKRNQKGIYTVELQEIIHSDLDYSKQGIVELTKRHVTALEQAIREQPELWAWQHNRWK
jgi:KDO2-lipid IV(A) lauroyltransferase